jgi:asparaginyl-tRNA synthetase
MKSIKSISGSDINTIVSVCGWVETARFQKKYIFVKIYDSWQSHLSPLQVIIESQYITDEALKLTSGDSIKITGLLVKSPKEAQPFELQGHTIEVFGKVLSPDTYPIAKTTLTLEHIRSYPHLECFSATKSAVYGVRSLLMDGIEQFFKKEDFTKTDMPLITFSECEGGCQPMQTTLFMTTGETKDIPQINGKVDFSKDFFGKKASLTVSSQLELETQLPLGKVWTVTRAIRGEPSATSRHLCEFSMIELEMPFIESAKDISHISESLIKYSIKYVIDDNYGKKALEFLSKKQDVDIIGILQKYISEDFAEITHRDAVTLMHEKEKTGEITFTESPKYDDDMGSEHEKYLSDVYFKKPVIIREYPKKVKAFYMPVVGEFIDGEEKVEYVDCFDLIVPGVGELVGGSRRIDKPKELEQRIEELHLEKDPLDFYLELRKCGSVKHGGMGMGFERLIKFVTFVDTVKDCVPYPRFYKSAKSQ